MFSVVTLLTVHVFSPSQPKLQYTRMSILVGNEFYPRKYVMLSLNSFVVIFTPVRHQRE